MPRKPKTIESVPTPPIPTLLVKYTLKAVIPTGPYANIQPEITVEATTLEEADKLIKPYIDNLFTEYLNKSERQKPRVIVTERDMKKDDVIAEVNRNEAYKKALTAVEQCGSLEALNMIEDRIKASVKLTAEEKFKLSIPVASKKAYLQGGLDDIRDFQANDEINPS